jgi:hypothetical protein
LEAFKAKLVSFYSHGLGLAVLLIVAGPTLAASTDLENLTHHRPEIRRCP